MIPIGLNEGPERQAEVTNAVSRYVAIKLAAEVVY